MPRVKRGTIKNKKRRAVLAQTKGYRFGRKAKKREAYEAINHAGNHAFAHRRRKKSVFRGSWHIAISSALQRIESNLSYSKLIAKMREKDVQLDRKIMADLAVNDEKTFAEIVKTVEK